MKIFIPFHIQDVGGTSIFAKKFSDAMIARGHEVCFKRPKDYDILFVIVHCAPQHLLHAKIHRKKIVQRLDGTYYWSVASWKYLLYNLPPALIHRYFADATVYQSQYSKYCVQKFLGKSHSRLSDTILNGVDTDIFISEGEQIERLRDNPEQKLFFSASKFRRTDQVIPLIEAMKIYTEKYNPNAKLVLAGSFSREVERVPKEYASLPYLSFMGKVPNQELPAYERSSDVFLFTHLNPPCPNNVIEAMACGLPICGVADGAMTEITLPDMNSLLIPAHGDAFWRRRTYDTAAFAANMHTLAQKREYFSQNSRKHAESQFSLQTMMDRYVSLFERL